MSEEVDPRQVTDVLLGDGWHRVHADSFMLTTLVVAGQQGDDVVRWEAPGFAFNELNGGCILGALDSLLAIRTASRVLHKRGQSNGHPYPA